MSFFKDSPLASAHTVRLKIAIPELHDLIAVLLRHWDIAPCLPGNEALEIRAAAEATQLDLVPSDGPAEALPLPFRLETLWLALQVHLFDPPREHFRVPLRIRGTLCQGSERQEFLSVSLSDAGMRFEFYRELIRDEEITLELLLDEEPLVIEGRVIYCVPPRSSGSMIIGVVYNLHQEKVKERLRDYLIEASLRQIRYQMNQQSFYSALSYLELPAASRARLRAEQ